MQRPAPPQPAGDESSPTRVSLSVTLKPENGASVSLPVQAKGGEGVLFSGGGADSATVTPFLRRLVAVRTQLKAVGIPLPGCNHPAGSRLPATHACASEEKWERVHVFSVGGGWVGVIS